MWSAAAYGESHRGDSGGNDIFHVVPDEALSGWRLWIRYPTWMWVCSDFGLAAILEVLGTADSLREEIDQPPPWTVTVLGLGSRVQTGAGHTVPPSALANISRLPDVLIVPALNVKQAPALIELVSSRSIARCWHCCHHQLVAGAGVPAPLSPGDSSGGAHPVPRARDHHRRCRLVPC